MLKGFLKLLFPPRCAACRKVMRQEGEVCSACASQFFRITGTCCAMCGSEIHRCTCKSFDRFYQQVVAPFYYEGAAVNAVLNVKRSGCQQAVEFLADAMYQTVLYAYRGVSFDLIVPVPMLASDRRRRGFSHAALLARRIGVLSGIPVSETALTLTRAIRRQHTLRADDRESNVVGAYEAIPEQAANLRILLVDDVATTCSTLDACAHALRLVGAKEVYCVTAAKTDKRRKKPSASGKTHTTREAMH